VVSLTNAEMECALGTYLKSLVMEQLLNIGKELAIANYIFDEKVPNITVKVDDG